MTASLSGKTSLLVRFQENQFTPNQKTTIGVDYKAKEIVIDGEEIKLQVIHLDASQHCCVDEIYPSIIDPGIADLGHRWTREIQVHDIGIL